MAGLAGRGALVTGAASAEGIGFATTRLLAEAGGRVFISSTTPLSLSSFPRKQESVAAAGVVEGWIPAFAGMTEEK